MKKLTFLAALLMSVSVLEAQPWMPEFKPDVPVKLQDVINTYKSNPITEAEDEEEQEAFEKEGVTGESKNYHFDRWVWYWSSHTDENGNLVSPQKTYDEWNAYIRKMAILSRGSKTTGTTANWSFQGPDQSQGAGHGVGRINTIAFHPTDPNTLWIGSAGGGAWKTTNGGSSWTPIYNNLPILGVSDIKFNPQNANTAYLCTGDGDGSDTYTIGIFKTTDGGATWDTTGLKFGSNAFVKCNSLIINPTDTNTLLVATTTGIYRTFNGGAIWTKVLTGNMKQLVYNPADTNIIYATGNGPSAFSANIYISHDGGTTWVARPSIANINRITLAVTPQNPAIVKAIYANTSYALDGIYTSSDTGNTFVKIYGDSGCLQNFLANNPRLSASTCDGQAWYDLPFTINPLDSNQVIAGGVNTWMSADGGKSWKVATQWTGILPGTTVVHADKHFLGYNPIAPTVLYEGNDGGIQKTLNINSLIWQDLTNGLGITQFYRLALSNAAPFVLGGAQDNGSKRIDNGLPTELTGGDGMQCQLDYSDSNIYYTAIQYGGINKSVNGGKSFSTISNNISSPAPKGSWVTPYIIHPTTPDILLAGYDKVYVSTDRGQTWGAFSPVFTSGVNIDRVVMSPANPNYVYVLVNNTIRYTKDFGVTWTQMPISLGGTMTNIYADPKNENNLWVTYGGYGTNKVALHSLTTNSWVAQNGTLPNIPVHSIVIDSANGTRYIGTDVAVFYRDTTMKDWALFNNNLPYVQVNDLAINYTSGELWAATYGRGMWKTPKYELLPNSISVIPFATNVITATPNPNKGSFTVSTSNQQLKGKTASARLINNIGRVMWQKDIAFSQNGDASIMAPGLPAGVYILDVAKGNTQARVRMVIY